MAEFKTYYGLDIIILPIILIAIWYLTADVLTLYPSYMFPGPIEVLNSFIKLVFSGELLNDILSTLYKIFLGLFLAAVVGISLGIILGWSKRLERISSLIVSVLRPIPPIAWIPFSILWFGIGTTPAVFIIFIGCVFTLLVNTIDGVHRTRKVLIESALSFGATDSQMITEVIIPSTIPYIASALKVSIAMALMCTVAAEMIASSAGLGYLILTSTNIFDTGSTVVGMLIIGLLGIIFDFIFGKIQEQVFW